MLSGLGFSGRATSGCQAVKQCAGSRIMTVQAREGIVRRHADQVRVRNASATDSGSLPRKINKTSAVALAVSAIPARFVTNPLPPPPPLPRSTRSSKPALRYTPKAGGMLQNSFVTWLLLVSSFLLPSSYWFFLHHLYILPSLLQYSVQNHGRLPFFNPARCRHGLREASQ